MNLQEKLSGLKGLVTHSHGKRRYKGDLTTDMISPPLGDFRHTMHVGRGGDVFGDTSFLSNHGGTANGNGGETDSITSPDNKIGAFFTRTLRQIRRGSDNRAREEAKELSPPPPAVSPIIKNAISLPRLDVDLPNGTPTRVLFPSSQNTPEDKMSSYGVDSGFVTLPRLSRSERQQPSISLPTPLAPNLHRGSLTDTDQPLLSTRTSALLATEPKHTAYSDSLPSLTSLDFTFDLGPSLMSEVLGLIDGGHLEDHGHAWEEGSACGLTNEGSEMDSATISYVDSLLREDCGGGKSPNWDEEEAVEVNERVYSVKMPDVVMGSAERVKGGVGMESERFQSATDVLARHYGGSSVVKGHYKMDTHSDMFSKKKISYSYIEDEDEIKV
ncbi:cdc42 effector protein 1 [Boleophthalmus pectinirostris]|uniref:cdc42 effector protein 1 n=1 Tax=Boleophthalmus pectinirostris TaxID=150288 RepID=UPI000A1C3F88|nr:cdc42 effector protein 1 [Boleophthalmus pectinirostris]